MASLLEDLAAFIKTAIPTEAFIAYGKEPAPNTKVPPSSPLYVPVTCVTLYRTGGPQADGTLDGAAIRERTVQVRVRDSSAASLDARADALHTLFAAQRPLTGYMGVVAISEVFTGYPLQEGASIGSFNLRITGG